MGAMWGLQHPLPEKASTTLSGIAKLVPQREQETGGCRHVSPLKQPNLDMQVPPPPPPLSLSLSQALLFQLTFPFLDFRPFCLWLRLSFL